MHRKGEENWKLFEKYFNRFYDGFFERLKERHETLTPNDLKVAAYVKLMLSTKEIASLMNISTGSVDTARHRLRRNLGLTSGDSLTTYLDNI